MQGYHQQQQVATAWQWHIFAATASRKQHVGHKKAYLRPRWKAFMLEAG